MHKLSFRIRERVRAAVFSLFILLLFLTAPGLQEKSFAQGVFSAQEQIYLKNITPLLYEFSQAAAEVSASVLKLQSAPSEECASRFADYRGIVGSLGNQLGTIAPPPRLETVHDYSMQALTAYLSGLELYFKACTEEDYGVKESMVRQGGVYLNKSVGDVGKAYEEIENLKAAGPAVVKKETNEEITEGDIPGAGLAEEKPDVGALKGESANTAHSVPPAPEVKTKAQVLEEISRKVQADMEAQEAAESEAPSRDSAVRKQQPSAAPREEVSAPEPPKKEAVVKTPEKKEIAETPEAVPPPPPSETPGVKPEEAPSVETAEKAEESAQAPAEVKTDKAGAATEAESSGKDKIEKLNQKIMEQTNPAQPKEKAAEAGPGESETPQATVPDEGKGTETPPGTVAAGNAEAENPAPAPENKELAAAPPGGVSEELKEEEVTVDDVKSWCQERYQDPSEREACMEERAAAKDKIDKLSGAYSGGTKEREVLDKCMTDWKEGSTYNYQMVISCTQFYCKQGGIEDCKNLSK